MQYVWHPCTPLAILTPNAKEPIKSIIGKLTATAESPSGPIILPIQTLSTILYTTFSILDNNIGIRSFINVGTTFDSVRSVPI